MMSHKDCSHESTPKARAACRRQSKTGLGAPFSGTDAGNRAKARESVEPQIRERAPRGKGQRRRQLEAEIAANAKRSAEEILASRRANGRPEEPVNPFEKCSHGMPRYEGCFACGPEWTV